jgi:glycosyltransferase involved in cell wall biosynthesis
MTNPKHTVIVITYNQENLISRSLDSLLCQKEYIFEIIIADDCSSDNTWEVIKRYQKLYPVIIKPYRNEKNLGIFGNIESTWTKPTGDIIWYLSGDDIYCDGLFAEANKLIKKNNCDYINEAFTLYFDYKSINPQGIEKVYRNNLVERYNPISLKIRQLICNRTTGVSRNVFDKFYPVKKDIGIMADGLIDIQTQLFSQKNYYKSFVGSVYYTNIGISSITEKNEMLDSYIKSLQIIKSNIKNLSNADLIWLEYLNKNLLFIRNPNFRTFIHYLQYYLLIILNYYGYKFLFAETKKLVKYTIKSM